MNDYDERERIYQEMRRIDAMIAFTAVLTVLLLLAALIVGALCS